MMEVRDVRLKEFIDGYHVPIDDELAELRKSNEADGVPLILTETEAVLRLLLKFANPRKILELGTAHGYSALFFAKSCPGASVTTIDRNPGMTDYAKENFAGCSGGERIDFRIGDAMDVLADITEEVKESGDRFDFVFIDAAKSHYREFLEICEKICTDDAFIVCDNILMKGWLIDYEGKEAKRHRTSIKYMKQFLDYISAREDLDVTILSGGDGLAIIRRSHD